MLRKENRLNKTKEIENVFKNGKSFYNDLVGVKLFKNRSDSKRFCIIISAKISKKATDRNKIKRRIRSIIFKAEPFFKKGFDCLIIIKKDLSNLKFSDLEILLKNIFQENLRLYK